MDDAAPTSEHTPGTGVGGGLHILILDPLFQNADQPGSTRTYDIGRRLLEAEHRVTVLTTAANLIDKGKTQTIDGLRIVAVSTDLQTRFGHPPAPALMAAFVRAAAWRMWRVREVDAVVVMDRPAGVLPLAMLFALVRGIPLILEVREGCPPRAPSGAPLVKRFAALSARIAYRAAVRYARHIVALSREVADTVTVRPEKFTVSAPGCDVTLFAAGPERGMAGAHPRLGEKFAVHAGVMNGDTKLERLIDLAAAMQPLSPETGFVFCGDGPMRGRLEAKALEAGVLDQNVLFLDAQRRRDLPALLTRARVIIADGKSNDFYDGLAAGRPMVLLSPGWQQELIESRGGGISLATDDPVAAARELADFMADADGLRRASQQAAALGASRFALSRITTEIKNIIEQTVAAEPRAVVMRRRALRTKRAIDIVAALAGLIVLSPVFAVIAIAIVWKAGWPIFFAQTRPGLKGKLFRIYKFRTMTTARDASGAALPDSTRLTPLGLFLRRASLDELPELVNVLMGDMSLVGPRPLLPEYLPHYTTEQRRRHDMRPGITGWSQVRGRNALTWEDKFALDVWYVDNFSLWLDIKIMLKTVAVLITGKGVSAPGHATMPRFDEIMARREGAEDV